MPSMRRFKAIFFLLVLSMAACAGPRKDPSSSYSTSQLLDMGERLLAAGEVSQALQYLTWAEKRMPKDPVVQYDLGLAYGARGMHGEAASHFRKAISLKQDYSEAYNALGALYAEQGDLDQAVYNLEKALENPLYITPHFPLYNLGRVYEKKSDWETALAKYKEAVRLYPYYGTAYYRIGQICEVLKRGDEAREAYGKAIQYSPDLVEAHLQYGIMSYKAGELENALYSLNQVVRLAPNSSMASEAKKYLDRLNGVIGDETRSSIPSDAFEKLTCLEVIDEKHVERLDSPPSPLKTPVPYRTKSGFEQGQICVLADPEPNKGEAGNITPEPNAEPKYEYIVQVGSYLDRQNAERLRDRLKAEGFKSLVKPFQHDVLGPVYVVQLKAGNDVEKAKTLVDRIERERKVNAIIIKIPAHL